MMSPLTIVRLVIAVLLTVAVILAARVRAPRRPAARRDVRRLLGGALGLELSGALALLGGRPLLATVVLAGGVATTAFVGWLSRGGRRDDPGGEPGSGGGGGRLPPLPPIGPIDWERFDRERRGWSSRRTPSPRPWATPAPRRGPSPSRRR
jgi:hypothetical protein